jgi:hypothetical protein
MAENRIPPISVTERFMARVCGRSLVGVAGSNPARGTDVWYKNKNPKCRTIKKKEQERMTYTVQDNTKKKSR